MTLPVTNRAGLAVCAAFAVLAMLSGCSDPFGGGDDGNARAITLKRVMLSTGGVGYFEYETEVDGTEQVKLSLPLDQMDDVLKSIVVTDDKGGGGTIEMPSRAPLSEIFRNLPVGPEAFNSAWDLLNALKGAEISVEGPVSASGRVLSVSEETAQDENGAVVTRHRVSLLSSSGVVQFVLEDADSIRFRDGELQAKLDRALEAIAQHRVNDGREIVITARGEGHRKLMIGYVVATPLWKTSYRLTTAEGADKVRLQGWAQIENASGQDWKDVELTLVSGNPVTFRQAIYTAYYVNRPEVPVEVLGRILPPADEGAVGGVLAGKAGAPGGAERAAASEPMIATMGMAPPPPPSPAPMAGDYDLMATGSIAAETSEAATQVTFKIPGSVSVGNGQSLAVPIIDRQVPGQAIALYDPNSDRRHPLAAVKLTNDSGTGLPPGVLTLYEQGASGVTYVGDARMNTLPDGESRMVSFALDQKTIVDREDKYERRVASAKISHGILTLSITDRRSSVYTIKPPAREGRHLVIEHPRDSGWNLIEPAADTVETTERAFRIPAELQQGVEQKLTVTTELPRVEEHILTNESADFIEAAIHNEEFSPTIREAFTKMREMRREIDSAQAEIEAANAERERLFEEQERIRANLGAVPERSELAQRYLRELAGQEDRADALARQITEAEAKRAAAQGRLADFVGGLDL